MSYDRKSVDRAIASSNRAGRKIGRGEAKLIHALLKGREEVEEQAPEAPDRCSRGER